MEALESPALSVSEAASQNAEFLVEKTAVASQLGLTMQGKFKFYNNLVWTRQYGPTYRDIVLVRINYYHH